MRRINQSALHKIGTMIRFSQNCRQSRPGVPSCLVLSLAMLLFFAFAIFPQAGTNSTGNGGRHTVQGTIFLDSGQRAALQGVKVTLQSSGSGDLTVFVDTNGTFAFKNLVPGSYVVILDGNDRFEPVKEPVYIDAPTGTSSISGAPRMLGTPPQVANVQIFLRPKAAEAIRNEVLNAKWSAISKDAIQHFKHGLELFDAGRLADAEDEFRTAISIAPNFAPAYIGIGTLQEKAAKYQMAVESFKEALRYDNSDYDANIGLGIAYFNLQKLDDAESPFVNAAYKDRFAVTPHYYLGLIFAVRNDVEVAQKAFEKVKELDGGRSYPIIHKYLGRIYLHKHMDKAAVNEFETYLTLLPGAKDSEAIKKEIAEIKGRPKAGN